MNRLKPLDYWLQCQRIAQAGRFVPRNSRVLDVGCADGSLFRLLRGRITEGIGIDPDLSRVVQDEYYRLLPGQFPQDLPPLDPVDVITMLAVLEHVPDSEHARWARACADLLRPRGLLVITVPSPLVDTILWGLKKLGLVQAMALEQHHGFHPRQTMNIFRSPLFEIMVYKRFQLGLNNIFVFNKI